LSYIIDGKVYWSVTNSATVKVPWRCSSYRFILRTDANLATPGSDGTVYLRRFKYTTLETYQNNPILALPAQQDSAVFLNSAILLLSTIFLVLSLF
jgi:hypothetical protein